MRRLAPAFVLLGILAGCEQVTDQVGEEFTGTPAEIRTLNHTKAGLLIEQALKLHGKGYVGVPIDHHVYVVALGSPLGGFCATEANRQASQMSRRFSWLNPRWKRPSEILKSAAIIDDLDDADRQYATRLLDLIQNYGWSKEEPWPGRFYLLALDAYHGPDGKPDRTRTDMFIPNDYVVDLRDCLDRKLRTRRFEAVVSIHPLRRDAVSELRRFAERGVRMVKWLPNVMGIDPSSEDPWTTPFYREMAKLGMVLLSQTGDENARPVPAVEDQGLGDPQHLRRPLDLGVTVVISHAGRIGKNRVRVHGRATNEQRTNFELVLDLMNMREYRCNLLIEISSVTLADSVLHFRQIVRNPVLRYRVINGSDYPLPAAAALDPTDRMVEHGFIDAEQQALLRTIYGFNPLLFDYVLKRTMTIKGAKGRALGALPESAFQSIAANRRLAKAAGLYKECWDRPDWR